MRVFLALLLTSLMWSVGCEPKPDDGRTPIPIATTPEERAAAVLERPRSPGEDDGLEVLRWSVTNNETAIRRALARYSVREVSLGADATALVDHGLRAAVIAESDLPKFLIDVGGTSKAVTVWFGQVPAWREVARTLLDGPRIAMISGKADRLNAGWLRLMIRAWTVPLEEGGVVEVMVAPQLVADVSDASGIQNRDVLRGRVWPEAVIHTELPRDTALVVVSAPAHDNRLEEDPEGPPPRPEAGGIGPAVEFPPTLGEFLLTDFDARPSRRLVLVLRARLPDILFGTPIDRTAAPSDPAAAPIVNDPPADAP